MSRRPLSLRTRVTVASIGVLGVGLIVLGVAINVLLTSTLSDDASSVLRDRASAELSTIEVLNGRVHVNEAPADAALDQHSWVIAKGRFVERAPARPEVDRVVRRLASVSGPTEREVNGRVRLLAQPAYAPGGGRHRIATVIVGVSLLPYQHTQHIVLAGSLALGLFVLLAGAFVVRRAVGAALRPVAEMTERAAVWSERDLHRRFHRGPANDELTALAATFDGLLGRIEAVLRHEQRFSAEMAHELRTPLTGVRAEAELALASAAGEPPLREALQRVVAGTDRMATVIDTLLTSARSESTAAPGSCAALVPVREVVASVRQAAAAHGVDVYIVPGAPDATVGADADVVAQALHPLVDNAIRHASARVRIGIAAGDGNVVISVEDDGAGVAPGDDAQIFQPGVSTAGGGGLGLPLARRLARAAGGDVAVAAAGEERGARFELRLPGASA